MRARVAVLVGLGLLAIPALARKPEDSFRRSIRLFTRAIPSFTSGNQSVSWYRTFSTDRIRRSEDGTWQFRAVAFLARPLDDFEVTLVFHDVSNRQRRFIRTTTAMVHDRQARVIKKRLVLRQPEFHPRRYYEVVATRRRREVTRPRRFWLGGRVDTGPQRVEFTEEEASEGPPDLDL